LLDTPEFQRLRWIEQSSFRVLFPAARHDRFIHSLGTYHLASVFIDSLYKNMSSNLLQVLNDDSKESLRLTFCYAALLHDVGHAPFSHTCEHFFIAKTDSEGVPDVYNKLIDAIQKAGHSSEAVQQFRSDYEYAEAKPHELVSALILVQNAPYFLDTETLDKIDLELAARMVLGVTYTLDSVEGSTDIFGIYNCVIRLLNSNTIDVDKLDYLSRDTYMSGFDSVSIDLVRLASSVTAVRDMYNNDILPAFKKSALSVIDNVFRAKSAQSQWIIQHPVVVYEQHLIQAYLNSKPSTLAEVFIPECLALPKEICDCKYVLLSDVDVLSIIKSDVQTSPLAREYFDRSLRRNPLWKSYFEYKYYFGTEEAAKSVYDFFEPLFKYTDENKIYNITKDTISCVSTLKKQHQLLSELSESFSVKFDFVVIKADTSFSTAITAKAINIKFPVNTEGNDYKSYSDLFPDAGASSKYKYFYLYTVDKLTPDQAIEITKKITEYVRKNTHPRT